MPQPNCKMQIGSALNPLFQLTCFIFMSFVFMYRRSRRHLNIKMITTMILMMIKMVIIFRRVSETHEVVEVDAWVEDPSSTPTALTKFNISSLSTNINFPAAACWRPPCRNSPRRSPPAAGRDENPNCPPETAGEKYLVWVVVHLSLIHI